MVDRRDFLRSALGYGAALAAALSLAPPTGKGAVVRPPGAVDPRQFTLLCLRCGQCAQVCPTKAIELMSAGPIEEIGLPRVTGQPGPCTFCYECNEICPTQVLDLGTVTDLQQSGRQLKLGTAFLAHPERCIKCDRCDEACPYKVAENDLTGEGEQVMRYRKLLEPISEGALEREIARLEDYCRGCGHCVNACPTDVLVLKPSDRKVVRS